MTQFPSQFPEWLALCERDGLGGRASEPPAIIRGEARAMVLSLAADTEFGNWTGGTFAARLRASPGADDPVIAAYNVSVGTPAGGLTPVTLTLNAAASAALPEPAAGTGWGELFLAITFAPTGGTPQTIIATRQIVKARV